MPDTTQQNQPTTDTTPTVKQALTPSGQNGTMSLGAAVGVLFVSWLEYKKVPLTLTSASAIGVVTTVLAGYFHEFMAILLNKLRS